MLGIRRYIVFIIFPLLAGLMFSGCSQEEISPLANGLLHLNIGHLTQKTETRATPTQIGKPLAENFNLKIQRSGSNYFSYEGKFVGDVELKVGSYNITAYYGENVVLGKNTPYYEGVATAVIEEGRSTSVTIPCRVANALVSVVFGRNEEETGRFDRFYEDYGIAVQIGGHSLAISYEEAQCCSIYFPAGSSPKLIFYGKLKETGEQVRCELSSTALPEIFEAADHAIVTLTLPDPESALNVDITKVEVVTAMLDETIPLSWLPISTATAAHHYDAQGVLVGTDVTFSNSYPGMQWKAVVANAAGEEVRSVSGMGELVSAYNTSLAWPYLPSGDYKATFYIEDKGNFNKVGSRDFSIGKPELRITLGGYSSYTKYLEGDIETANKCDRKTIYDLSVALNVSETLLAKYPYSFTFQYASMDVENVAASKNKFTMTGPLTNQAVRLAPYRLKADASFDGVSVHNYKDFYITGLPVTYAPPKKETGWVAGTDYVTFSDSEVKLGERGSLTAHYDEYIYNTDFAVPRQSVVTLDYSIMIRPATMGTTLTFSLGEDLLLSKREAGGAADFDEYPHSGSETIELFDDATELKCLNSYGGSMTYSCIYSLSLKYGRK